MLISASRHDLSSNFSFTTTPLSPDFFIYKMRLIESYKIVTGIVSIMMLCKMAGPVTAYEMLAVMIIMLIISSGHMFGLASMPQIIFYVWVVMFLRWTFIAAILSNCDYFFVFFLFHNLYSLIP